jgi:succinate dehydrogenase / fumarate reductase flavoprotein subunit
VKYVREFDYVVCGQSMHATDAVDISLVRPRPRKYETAGAASAAAAGKLGEKGESVKAKAEPSTQA